MKIYSSIVVVSAFLILDVRAQSGCRCGVRGRCCDGDETCEASVDGGTCYKTGDRVSCNDLFYCYAPTVCCGVGKCCEAGSKCCDSDTCCPKDSECCGYGQCCDTSSTSSGLYGFRWYYFMFALLPLVAICAAVSRMRRTAMARSAARSAIVRHEVRPDNRAANFYPPAFPYPSSDLPPHYDDIENVPPSIDGATADEEPKIPQPPSYEEVMSSSTQPETAGTVNSAYETDRET